jgi:hypothetical protein
MPRNLHRKEKLHLSNKGRSYQRLVASVVQAIDPGATVEEGKWISGPDGKRDMDVLVKGSIKGQAFSTLIECKDYDVHKTGPIGINFVDAIESKRKDLSVDFAMICSNSGFTSNAIRKAKRTGIGLVSILKAKDPRIKVEIVEELYTRNIRIKEITIDFGTEVPQDVTISEIYFEGSRLIYWVSNRILLVLGGNYVGSGRLLDSVRLKEPIKLIFGRHEVTISKIDISFEHETEWFSQVISIDATLGMYDFLRRRIRLPPCEGQYSLKDFNPYGGKPIDFVPQRDNLMGSLLPGEFKIDLFMVEGLQQPADPLEVPDLNPFIIEDDLDWRVPE